MRILVTGGHGFIGTALVRRLLEGGAEVRCLYRRPGRPATLEGLDVEVVRGDVRDSGSLAAAVAGVDVVHHLAGLTSSLTCRAMFATNADGTANLLTAAERAGLTGRFVLCSSLAAVGPSAADVRHVEGAPCRPLTWYGESKAHAERIALERRDRVPVTVVRPPAVYGPGDLEFLPLFRSAALRLALVPGDPRKRYSMVYVDDLTAAFVEAARAEATSGKVFFAAHDEVVDLTHILDAAEAAVGRRALRVVLPASLLRLGGCLTDLVSQLTGKPSILGSQRVREVAEGNWTCSSEALEAAIGWRARVDLAEGFARTAAWYRENALLRSGAGNGFVD